MPENDPWAGGSSAATTDSDPWAGGGAGAASSSGPVSDFLGNYWDKTVGGVKNAVTDAWKRQQEEGSQIADQFGKGQYGKAAESTLRAIPGADMIRNESANTFDKLKQAWQNAKQGNYQQGIRNAERAVPMIGNSSVDASEQIERGDVAGGLGSAAGLLSAAAAPELFKGAKAGVNAGIDALPDSTVGTGLKGARQGLMDNPVKYQKLIPWGVAGEFIPGVGWKGGAAAGATYHTLDAALAGAKKAFAERSALADAAHAEKNAAYARANPEPRVSLADKAGIEATPPEAPQPVNPIAALQTPTGRKPGGIQNQPAPVVTPQPPPRVSLADMLGIEATPQAPMPPVDAIPGALPSGRTPGGIQNQVAPVAAQPPPPRVSLADQMGITATPQEPQPQVNPIAALQTPSGRKPGGIQNQVAEDLKPPTATEPAYDGPSKDVIAKSLGMKGGYKSGNPQQIATIDKIYNDMVAKAARPGIVAPQPVSAPTAPIPQQAPSAAPANLPAPKSTVVEHDWKAPNGDIQHVKLMGEEGLSDYASEHNLDPEVARQQLMQQGYKIDDRPQLMKSLMFHAKEIFGPNDFQQKVYDLFKDKYKLQKMGNASEDKILKVYQDVLDTPGAMTKAGIGHVDWRKGNMPVDLTDQLRQSLQMRTKPLADVASEGLQQP